MGRRQFRQDLSAAAQDPPPHIADVRPGEDGEISFEYRYLERGATRTVILQLLALNVDDYPHENEYMIFAPDGDVTSKITDTFDILCPLIRNRSIHAALAEVSTCLQQATTVGQASNPIDITDLTDAEDEEEYDDMDNQSNGAEDWLGEDDEDAAFGFEQSSTARLPTVGRQSLALVTGEDVKKIKSDLRQAKEAGFKIGIIGDLSTSGIVSVSIRVSKLGISEEGMKAWGLESSQYFVLLIRCQNGYRSIDRIKEDPILSGSTEIRLGLCQSYKPDSKSAFDAFNEVSQNQISDSQPTVPRSSTELLPLFIGRPLNELFRSRFARIIKFREVYNLGWAGAEQFVHDTQGANINTMDMNKYDFMTDDNESRALPYIVMEDSMSGQLLNQCSLPLVAMQFALRHFVRCTDFCLVCHCSSGSTFEALKPYVCSNPLCLYQYMGLGFGPSIEWEILSQPYVVDLLISFCYFQAQATRLKDFPVGIGLKVPILPSYHNTYPANIYHVSTIPQSSSSATDSQHPASEKAFTVPYNYQSRDILVAANQMENVRVLKVGDFVALVNSKYFSGTIYHRIEYIMLPSVTLGPPILSQVYEDGKDNLHPKSISKQYIDVDCYLFDHSFDDLSDEFKCKSIMSLLDTIPPVKEMLHYLKAYNSGQQMSLRQWRDRISPSALNVLRWIIASNRSCIMQVDTIIDGKSAEHTLSAEDRVTGMDEYMQFRFAQGAPDKEQRFIDCVKKETGSSQYPTLFAWHGSPLHNWHSIIREGLHFKETNHGRAFGHGVYMSSYANTSVGYMGGGFYSGRGTTVGWPHSELKVSTAMSLNEVVNKPAAFVSSSPHYVVDNLDWIQTRYLFVKTQVTHGKGNQDNVKTIIQDPHRTAVGVNGGAVAIPMTAISKSRRPKLSNEHKDSKKRKSVGSGLQYEPIEILDDEDAESIATSHEDRAYLLDDESHTGHTPIVLDSDSDVMLSNTEFEMVASPNKRIRQAPPAPTSTLVNGALLDPSMTDFFPGQLDMSNIKVLPPPDDASLSATNQLMRAFKSLIKTQSSTLAHVLGWYIDPERVDNMYQWLVELHSFDKDIPLAQNMKDAGITSIVVEMRFTNQYPFAPPFVRVIKPRFLPFSQGGGGHVTEGGAICMELLTNNGWTAVSSMESILMQIRLAMSEKERPAMLATRNTYGRDTVYGVGEAIAAYERACHAHGWTVPPSFSNLQRGEDGPSRR